MLNVYYKCALQFIFDIENVGIGMDRQIDRSVEERDELLGLKDLLRLQA